LRCIEARETVLNRSNRARILSGGVVAPKRVLVTAPYACKESQRFQCAKRLASVAFRSISSFDPQGDKSAESDCALLIHQGYVGGKWFKVLP
jgi:hypothetical protein